MKLRSKWIYGFVIVCLICCSNLSFGQPVPALIGYWHNWNSVESPFVPLQAIDSSYNVVMISFALPTSPTDMTMTFSPEQYTPTAFISEIQQLQSDGKKVLLSIGGATGVINLTDQIQKQNFVTSLNNLITTYGFDGLDIDIEHGDCIYASGTISAPNNTGTLNLISAIQSIMDTYQTHYGRKMWLTMAPETAYVQGGISGYGSIWGGYLPLIHALRNEIDIIAVQLYNSGSIYGLDGTIYTQGTADFIVALTEAIIHGFNTAGGFFTGVPASKIAVGLPACSSAAGGGYIDPATVATAINYLKGEGPQPGGYTLLEPEGYPDLRGMMTWSVNWDATECGGVYSFAQNFRDLFSTQIIDEVNYISHSYSYYIYPNPSSNYICIKTRGFSDHYKWISIYNCFGRVIKSHCIDPDRSIDIHDLPNGIYFLTIDHKCSIKFIVNR